MTVHTRHIERIEEIATAKIGVERPFSDGLAITVVYQDSALVVLEKITAVICAN
jgi:hypothetical protein